MVDEEIPLAGGNTSEGVVRIGNTVRKKLTQNSPTIHKLLKHIVHNGFTHCPKFLGTDSNGREILAFIDGETGIPSFIWESDDCLKETATILRRYHDATVDFPHDPNDSWAFTYPDRHRHEVIGHSDFAPYNFIFRNKLPISVIDFDLAGPAPRSRDMAYSAYWNVPLSFNDKKMKDLAVADLNNGCKRLKLFCEAYGTRTTSELLDMTSEVLAHMGNEDIAIEMIGKNATKNLREGGHFHHWRNELSAFNEKKVELLRIVA